MNKSSRMYDPPHPGGVLRRLDMEPRGVTVTELAKAIGVSRTMLSQVVNGHARITPDLAVRLSRALDTGPDVWLNMQAQYDLWQAAHMEPHKEIKPLPGVRKAATA